MSISRDVLPSPNVYSGISTHDQRRQLHSGKSPTVTASDIAGGSETSFQMDDITPKATHDYGYLSPSVNAETPELPRGELPYGEVTNVEIYRSSSSESEKRFPQIVRGELDTVLPDPHRCNATSPSNSDIPFINAETIEIDADGIQSFAFHSKV